MPKQVYRFKNFKNGLIDKVDELDVGGLQTAKNVMVDYQGQIRPAEFTGVKMTKNNTDFVADYDIENTITWNSYRVQLDTLSEPSRFQDSDYEFGYSFVFADNGESTIYSYQIIEVTSSEAAKLQCTVDNFATNMKGMRWYVRDTEVGNDWYYLGTWDGSTWSQLPESNLVQMKQYSGPKYLHIDGLPPITYEAINGYKADVDSLGLDNVQDSTRANGRVFAIRNNDNKIYYSKPGRFGCFPRYNDGSGNILNPIESDAQAVAIVSFGDMLVYCTEKDISYISVNGMPSNWQVAKVYRNQGILDKNHILTSDNGIFWVNQNGSYYSGSKGVTELSINIEWDKHILDVNNIVEVAYYPLCNYIKVTDTNDNYLAYNLRTKNWVEGDSNSGQSILTNKTFLKAPHYRKKIYKVYITYNSDKILYDETAVTIFADGEELSTVNEIVYNFGKEKTTAIYVFDSIPEVNVCSVKIDWDVVISGWPDDFTILDIGVEYRPLTAKRI